MSYWIVEQIDSNENVEIQLPASKSISNRALILQYLVLQKQNKTFSITGLSEADDTKLMLNALNSEEKVIQLKNAGTCMRFLTAYFSILPGIERILDGDIRMQNRPISGLVNALRELGADISYLGKEGFPPLLIKGKSLKGGKVLDIDGTESSQYLSAMLLISPFLQHGCTFKWNKNNSSASYNLMTVSVLKDLGFSVEVKDDLIQVFPANFNSIKEEVIIEADWSSAAFFYEMLVLKKAGKLLLKNLKIDSIQGDAILHKLMEAMGLVSHQTKEGVEIEYSGILAPNEITFDCKQCPDLVPALVIAASSMKNPTKFTGLSNLNFKESKRLDELVKHLGQMDVLFQSDNDSIRILSQENKKANFVFDTAKDHRMVMAYAMLAFHFKRISLNEINWVEKSFPHFWQEVSKLGLTCKETN